MLVLDCFFFCVSPCIYPHLKYLLNILIGVCTTLIYVEYNTFNNEWFFFAHKLKHTTRENLLETKNRLLTGNNRGRKHIVVNGYFFSLWRDPRKCISKQKLLAIGETARVRLYHIIHFHQQ